MTDESPPPAEPHMHVYKDRVVLVNDNGKEETFYQGPMSPAAEDRYRRLNEAFSKGWLEDAVAPSLNPASFSTNLAPDWQETFERLADGVTDQHGRAMVAITILQLAIKALEPQQSIRLSKGQRGPSIKKAEKKATKRKDDFSWTEGISMRSLSREYLVPFLRRYEFLKLNRDGPFMTRAYAENYPYCQFYKAAVRGPRDEWLRIIEGLEDGSLDAKESFVYLSSLLANRSDAFRMLAKETMRAISRFLDKGPTVEEVRDLIASHIENSMNPARPLEIALHCLYQTLYMEPMSNLELRHLSQMRAANKKMKSVGDVELLRKGSNQVIVAWDAKIGHLHLTTELEELREKLDKNRGVQRAGFVLNGEPIIDETTRNLIAKIRLDTGTDVQVLAFTRWVDAEINMAGAPVASTIKEWLRAYAETLCQMRRDIAPIDEPSRAWVEGLKKEVEKQV